MIQGQVFQAPDAWLDLNEAQRFGGLCDLDLCMTPAGECFIRSVLELAEGDDLAEMSVWAMVNAQDFRRYYETYSDLDQSKLGELRGRLANEVEGFAGSLGLGVRLVTQDDGQRPLMMLEPSDHPLSLAQRAGRSAA